MLPQEIEIKLDLQSEENYNKLINRFRHKGKQTRQENYFFDSETMDLSKSGWALRLRTEENKSTLTLKGRTAKSSGGLAIRDEVEVLIQDETAKKYAINGLRDGIIPDEIAQIIRPMVNPRDLVQKLYFVNNRFRVNFSSGNIDLLFEIDKTEYADGSIDYELEIELDDHLFYQKALGEITTFLNSIQIVSIFQKHSKFARALKREKLGKLIICRFIYLNWYLIMISSNLIVH